MPRLSVLKSVLALALTAPLFGSPLIVHEWGTFTSVAGGNGLAVSWAPLAETSDLPCFVYRLGKGAVKYSAGLVRMETPVLYFYSPMAMKVSVHVDFPQGWITEWYPKASHVFPDNPEAYGTNPGGGAMYQPERGSIDWTDLSIQPGAQPQLPTTKGASRYFAARATDSTPLQSGDQSEKMLFYRGIADFQVPLAPVVTDTGISIRRVESDSLAIHPIPFAMLFENQNGQIGYRIMRDVMDHASIDKPQLNASPDLLRSDLIGALEQAGLYPKEAAAMVETWHDSWFEEGTRLFYIMPRTSVDAVLPLRVKPAQEIQRVFVGRVEVLSSWTERTIRGAMANGDTKTLAKFGRFLPPFVEQIKTKGAMKESPVASSYVKQVQEKLNSQLDGPAPCVQ